MAHLEYDQAWKEAKKEFEAITGKHKPKDSKGFMNAYGMHTGLSRSLKECEKSYQACFETVSTEIKKGKKNNAAFLEAYKKFKVAKKPS